jgi:protein gp37
MVFVDSMSDLFYPYGDYDYYRFLAAVFGVMAYCEQHTFQILTKRPAHAEAFFRWLEGEVDDLKHAETIRDFCAEQAWHRIKSLPRFAPTKTWPLRNVWILVSAENQEMYDKRVARLFEIPAVVHGVSMEPMLEDIELRFPLLPWPKSSHLSKTGLDWIIVGCEKVNGRQGRSFDYQWARHVRDQCKRNGFDIPFYFKQSPESSFNDRVVEAPILDGKVWNEFPDHLERP